MRVCEFLLVNEKGQSFSLMDMNKYCLITEPNGLGYSYNIEYQQLGSYFIENVRKIEQGRISAQLVFKNYDNYSFLVNFIETSENLKLLYKIPYKKGNREFYRDVDIVSLTKTCMNEEEKLKETITINCKSLWYEKTEIIYDISPIGNEIRWDFFWDSIFMSYDNRNISFENKGHTAAPFTLEMEGHLISPSIFLFQNNQEIAGLKINTTFEEYEKFLYSSKDNDIYIYKQRTDGSLVNLFNELDINNNNFFRIPKRDD